MVLFSGISGSKMADVAAVGSVLIPAARRSRQNPGSAVALLAASAVMAETIPPCINLIILGFVANLSIGGLFVAGAAAGRADGAGADRGLHHLRPSADAVTRASRGRRSRGLWSGAIASFGLIFMIFFGFKSGFATATEISAFAAVYAIVIGGIVFRELSCKSAAHSFVQCGDALGAGAVHRRRRAIAGLHPHLAAGAACGRRHRCWRCRARNGVWLFMLLSIVVLIVMGSVLEGAAALIIFGPLLLPVAVKLGIDPLHFGVVLVIAMGIGLFAPPLGLGLYGACLIGNVPIEQTVKPIMGYLGLLFLCLLVIAFVPAISTSLPRAFGY